MQHCQIENVEYIYIYIQIDLYIYICIVSPQLEQFCLLCLPLKQSGTLLIFRCWCSGVLQYEITKEGPRFLATENFLKCMYLE